MPHPTSGSDVVSALAVLYQWSGHQPHSQGGSGAAAEPGRKRSHPQQTAQARGTAGKGGADSLLGDTIKLQFHVREKFMQFWKIWPFNKFMLFKIYVHDP